MFLRKYLSKHYPNHIIPPLLSDGKLAEDLMKHKEVQFYKFLQDCLRNPDLRSSFLMMEFLSMADEKGFAKMMKDREKDKAPDTVERFYSSTGKAKIASTVDTWEYCAGLRDFHDQYRTLNN